MPPKSHRKASRSIKKRQVRLGEKSQHGNSRRAATIFTKTDNTKTGFSDLPPELRNLIYAYALHPSSGDAVPFRLLPELGRYKEVAFNLLNTCKGARTEATGIFYGQNTFRVDLLQVTEDMTPLEMRNRLAAVSQYGRWRKEDDPKPYNRIRSEMMAWERAQSLAQLFRGLAVISPRDLSLIKSFTFAYHVARPENGQSLDAYDFTRTPELTVDLKLQKRSPYFTIEQQINANGKHIRICKPDTWVTRYIAATIQTRNLRALAKMDVQDVAQSIASASFEDLKGY